MDEVMAEHILMPGWLGGFIVTRDFAYQWLKAQGWNPSDRGYGSLDHTVFIKPAVDDELTPIDERDRICSQIAGAYAR